MYYPKDWKVNGPQESSTASGRGKFIDISRLTPEGRLKEQMLVSYYPSKGTFKDDAVAFPQMVKETNETLKKLLPGYQVVSEGEIKDNGDVYTSTYEGPYCVGCEEFKTSDDVVEENGATICPIHRNATLPRNRRKAPCGRALDGHHGPPFVRRNRAREEFPMIGLVLVTHGRLAVEFRSALEHVVGPQRQIEAVTIGPDDDVEQRRAHDRTRVGGVDRDVGRGRAKLGVDRRSGDIDGLGGRFRWDFGVLGCEPGLVGMLAGELQPADGNASHWEPLAAGCSRTSSASSIKPFRRAQSSFISASSSKR